VDALKIVLGTLGTGAILFWVVQGSLSTRLDMHLSGQVYPSSSPGKMLVVASFRVANVGNSDVGVESAKLTIIPKKDGDPLGKSETLDTVKLDFAPGVQDKNSISNKLGLDTQYYFLTWGTQEARQISQVLTTADYYEIYLDIVAVQRFPRGVSTWRTVTVVPTKPEQDRSPAFDEPDKDKSSIRPVNPSSAAKSAA